VSQPRSPACFVMPTVRSPLFLPNPSSRRSNKRPLCTEGVLGHRKEPCDPTNSSNHTTAPSVDGGGGGECLAIHNMEVADRFTKPLTSTHHKHHPWFQWRGEGKGKGRVVIHSSGLSTCRQSKRGPILSGCTCSLAGSLRGIIKSEPRVTAPHSSNLVFIFLRFNLTAQST